MGSTILHVLYLHQCDHCGKKKRSKLPLPEGWFKTTLFIFCRLGCKIAHEQEVLRKDLIAYKQQYPNAVVELPVFPTNRKQGRRYKR